MHNCILFATTVITRSHTAQNNTSSMSDRRLPISSLNNNCVVGSSPSKLEPNINNNEQYSAIDGETPESEETQNEECTKAVKNKDTTPTKKSVSNSILSFTSSFLAAAAASSTVTGLLPVSPTQSPTKERHVIDLSSHSTPRKRGSTPSASPTRRGGRATKPSPHQGTPPQSPPTPHKIICQATVETIVPGKHEATESDEDSGEEDHQCNIANKLRVSPNKKKCSSPSSKLISVLSPKKNHSSAIKKLLLAQTLQKSPKHSEIGVDAEDSSNADSDTGETTIRSARRNLTSMLMTNKALDTAAVEESGTALIGPKKR